VSTIQAVFKDGVKDVVGERVAFEAARYLGIDTGCVRSSKLYTLLTPLTDEQLRQFATHGLKDAVLHEVYVNSVYRPRGFRSYIAVGKRPGVTDDEGASAQKSLCDVLGITLDGETQQIFTRDVFYLEHHLDETAVRRIAEELLGNALIHHFDCGEISAWVDYVPQVKIEAESKTESVDIFVPDRELDRLSRKRVLSLSLPEWHAIQGYYRDETVVRKREAVGLSPAPTDCELEVFAQTWSEHCKHKEFNALIHYTDLETGKTKKIDSLFDTYIRGATETVQRRLEGVGQHWLVKVFSDNAGVVRIDDEHLFVFKVETHNTPSALDPYGGALTGILGNNRDPLGTGRGGGRLLFNTNVLCFAPPTYSQDLLCGQLHPRRVFAGVRRGIEDGGNKSGVPTVNGAIVFDDRYAGKPLVYCGTGSIMPALYQGKNAWEKEIAEGDRIVAAGGRVGVDGIHGATFSSAEIDENSPRSAVQIGSPITQKMLSDFLEVACEKGLVKCCTDNGAGGLSCSIGELATISGGAEVQLAHVPLKYAGIKPWEIFLSESQERMTLVVEEEKLKELFLLAAEYEVEVTDIGQFTRTGALEVFWNETLIAYLDLDFLYNGVPRKTLDAEWKKPRLREPQLPLELDYNEILPRLLASPNICSKERVIRQYDHEVKGKTVIKPLMGPTGTAPQDAAVVRIGLDGYQGVAISNGIIPRYGDIDPYAMSAGAFDEAVRQIIAVGGKLPNLHTSRGPFWSVNDNFCLPDSVYDERMNPDGKVKLGKLVRMCEALYDMATFYNTPLTSGKDSMKNDFRADGVKISVPPTVLYSMVAGIDDVRNTVTSEFKHDGDLIYLLGGTYDELGGSEFYRLYGELGAKVPTVRKEEAGKLYSKVMEANDHRLLESCHDVSDGGLAVALVESAIGGDLGIVVELGRSLADNLSVPQDPNLPAASSQPLTLEDHKMLRIALLSESHSRFVVSVRPDNREVFEALTGEAATMLGGVTRRKQVVMTWCGRSVVDVGSGRLYEAWSTGLRD